MIDRKTFVKQIKPDISGLNHNKLWSIDLVDVNQNYAIRLDRGVYNIYSIVPNYKGAKIDYYIGKRYKLADAKDAVYDHYQNNYEKYKRR